MGTAVIPSRYHYGLGSDSTTDRIGYRKNTPANQQIYSVGKEFDTYDFSRPAMPFEEAIITRLQLLRESGRYLRFWFSGGKDSLMILKHAQKANIKFDEIVLVKNLILGPHCYIGSITEIMENAAAWIEENRTSLAGTKITYIDFTAEEYALVFQDPTWIHHSNLWYLHLAYAPNLFYKFVEPAKKFLDDIPDRYDILGSIHPHIWWDDGWKFCYVDMQFQQYSWPTQENFLATPDFPELVHSYARSVVKSLDSRGIQFGRFQDAVLGDTNQLLRNVRDLLPTYQFELPRSKSQYPKTWSDPWRPTEDLFWKGNCTYKTTLSALILFYQNPREKFFDDYCNLTDWQQICNEMSAGGICSQTFSL
jgi:hypothetical protein